MRNLRFRPNLSSLTLHASFADRHLAESNLPVVLLLFFPQKLGIKLAGATNVFLIRAHLLFQANEGVGAD